MGEVAVTEEPKQEYGAKHNGGIDLGDHGPAKGHDQSRGYKFIDCRSRIARAINPHGKPLLVFWKPTRHIGCTDRKRTAGQTHKQTNGQKMPISGGIGHEVNRRNGECHQDGHHDTAAILVGPNAQRHSDQGTGEHRCCHQQTKLRGIEVKRFFNRNADDAKHHPHHETHCECQCAED